MEDLCFFLTLCSSDSQINDTYLKIKKCLSWQEEADRFFLRLKGKKLQSKKSVNLQQAAISNKEWAVLAGGECHIIGVVLLKWQFKLKGPVENRLGGLSGFCPKQAVINL